jgi:hypothetical protein
MMKRTISRNLLIAFVTAAGLFSTAVIAATSGATPQLNAKLLETDEAKAVVALGAKEGMTNDITIKASSDSKKTLDVFAQTVRTGVVAVVPQNLAKLNDKDVIQGSGLQQSDGTVIAGAKSIRGQVMSLDII